MDKDKKKPNGCMIGCLSVIVLLFAILILAYACSGGKTPLSTAKDTYEKIADISYDSQMPQEEKATQAKEILDKLTPTMDELEKEKDEKLPKMGRTFQLWQAYVSMAGACNGIIREDNEYAQKCLGAAHDSLERAEEKTD